MATYKVAGVGEHGKFFDGNSYQDAINYVCNPQKAAFVGGCNVTSADKVPLLQCSGADKIRCAPLRSAARR